jgi:erythromycin esterase-like protein
MGVFALRLLPISLLLACASAAPRDPPARQAEVTVAIAAAAEPLRGAPEDYDSLMALIGDNRFVLLGESTHGTQEFYAERARLTRRLIEEKGFTVVVVESNWQDAYDVNAFIHGRGPASADEAMQTFEAFPQWMWGNTVIRDLVTWMRDRNRFAEGQKRPVGFYGMDLYGVEDAIADVIAFLKTHDPAAAERAAGRYKCFGRYRGDRLQQYGEDVALGRTRSCADVAAAQFKELSERVERQDEHRPGDERLLAAWQSARVVANGEAYYRTVVAGGVASWNLRDRHMADTLDMVSHYLGQPGAEPAKVIVWAHNSHLGDARVTARSEVGELNVGQLMRERHDGQTVIVGFTTYEGTVRAASFWGGRGEERTLRPSLPESFSALFHGAGVPAFVLRLRHNPGLMTTLGGSRLQRFVGVIYMPATERQSHYFHADLARQYDAVIHIDRTTAVEPLQR